MARPEIKLIEEMTPAVKRRLMGEIGPLSGIYEVSIVPRRNTRSSQQNRYFHGVIVEYFHKFLAAQDYEHNSREAAKGFIKAKCLLQDLVDKETGEVCGRRVRGTSELTVEEFAEFIDRSRTWLSDFFGIVVPDPDPMYGMQMSGRKTA